MEPERCKRSFTLARTVELQEREKPVPGPGEALVRVHNAGTCGSDAHAYKYDESSRDWVPGPRVMGHEYSGPSRRWARAWTR